MGLIKKPSEITSKKTISCLIYGNPGAGKTTLACSAPNPVLFDYDGGVQRINGAFRVPTVQITSWEDTQAAINEINAEMPECQTVVIDTVGKMLDYMSAYIIKNDPKMGQRDGSLSLKGYGVRKQMFVNFIKSLAVSGRNVIFVAHEREDKRGEETVKRPEISGSSAGDLLKELDLVGYVQMIGKDRTVSFDPTEWYYAKNACCLPSIIKIPKLLDDDGNVTGDNAFFCNIIRSYVNYQAKQNERVKECEDLVSAIADRVNEADDLESLNAVYKDVMGLNHVSSSKVKTKQMLAARAAQLGYKFDKLNKCFVAA